VNFINFEIFNQRFIIIHNIIVIGTYVINNSLEICIKIDKYKNDIALDGIYITYAIVFSVFYSYNAAYFQSHHYVHNLQESKGKVYQWPLHVL
jgi:hypothetical protein